MGMILYNWTTREVLARDVNVAYCFAKRFKGLMFTKKFPDCGGLIIKPCGGVHTFFMRYPLDVILLDEQNRIIYKKINMPPNRITSYFRRSRTAVELPGGSLLGRDVSHGDELKLIIEEADTLRSR